MLQSVTDLSRVAPVPFCSVQLVPDVRVMETTTSTGGTGASSADMASNANRQQNKSNASGGQSTGPSGFKPGRKFGLTGQRHQPVNQVATTPDGRRLSARDEPRNSWMYSLSEQEMEDKYNAICLSIRTDNLTLTQRLDHQHAERDLVENNLKQEVQVLHSLLIVSLFPLLYTSFLCSMR